MSIVLILGGFHTMMSYYASIGTLIEACSLSEALKTCYGDVSVKQIASGKAISKAVCAHFLTEVAIMTLLMNPDTVDEPIFPTFRRR